MRTLLSFGLAVWIASAQQAPAPVFRATTELVQVNVVALDKSGKLVADLRREEFQLLDNGVPQEIGVFSGQGANATASAPQSTTGNTFTNEIARQSGSQSGYTVILIDNLHSGSDPTNEEGSSFARTRALKVLGSIPAGEKIAIYAPGITFQVICEFTSDRELLERQLKKWSPRPTTPAPETRPILSGQSGGPQIVGMQGGNIPPVVMQSRAPAEMDAIDAQQRNEIGDFQFQTLADHLSGIPGRKKMLWLANKFPVGPRALQSLNRAGVSIYPVDIDGVCRLCPERPKRAMDAIAAMTGGVAYYTRNDIEAAMLEAIHDAKVSYTLGFYSSGADGAVHGLRITVSRPGVQLRYGNTYQPSAPSTASLSSADLVKAMNRPIDATTIPIRASVTKMRDLLRLDVMLNAESLDLIPDGGRWTGHIEFAARFATADALIASDPFTQTVTFNLSQESYDGAVRAGMNYHYELPLPAKAVELRLLFANPASGKIGTVTIPLSRVR